MNKNFKFVKLFSIENISKAFLVLFILSMVCFSSIIFYNKIKFDDGKKLNVVYEEHTFNNIGNEYTISKICNIDKNKDICLTAIKSKRIKNIEEG